MWFVIQTNPNCERKAAAELRRAGVRAYLPKRSFERKNRKTGKTITKHMPLLTGYLFVRFPEEMHYRGTPEFGKARACQGVKNFLREVNAHGDFVPFPVPDKVVAEYMRRQRLREFDDVALKDRRMRATYRKGRHMRVSAGPFEEFLATIQKLRDNGGVEAEISVLGRSVRIVFDEPDNFLDPIANAA